MRVNQSESMKRIPWSSHRSHWQTQILKIDLPRSANQGRSGNHLMQFLDVSGPAILHHQVTRFEGESFKYFSITLIDMFSKLDRHRLNVIFAKSERRKLNHVFRELPIKAFPELSFFYLSTDVSRSRS